MKTLTVTPTLPTGRIGTVSFRQPTFIGFLVNLPERLYDSTQAWNADSFFLFLFLTHLLLFVLSFNNVPWPFHLNSSRFLLLWLHTSLVFGYALRFLTVPYSWIMGLLAVICYTNDTMNNSSHSYFACVWYTCTKIPRSRIHSSKGLCICKFDRSDLIFFHRSCTYFYSQGHCSSQPGSPCP